MATFDATKLTTNEQKQVLGSLRQPVAASLIGMSSRALRDNAEVPRNSDNTYDAKSIVGWSQNRATSATAKLTDAENEMIAEIIDTCLADEAEWRAESLIEFFQSLRDAHGDGGWVGFVGALLDYFAAFNRQYPSSRHSADDIRDAGRDADQQKRQRMRHDNHRRDMTISYRCEGCGKYRWGKKWNNNEPPATNLMFGIDCPKCLAK